MWRCNNRYNVSSFNLIVGKAVIEVDDENTTILVEQVNELLEAYIGIDDLELGNTIYISIKK